MAKNVFKIVAVFIIGVIGGIFADQIFWPYFIERPLFYKYRLEQAPIYVAETNEIVIQENSALQDAVEQVEKTVIGLRTTTAKGTAIEGSGIIVTSDGLIITLAELVPQDGTSTLFVNGRRSDFQILKRNLENNLVLIKIEEESLPTVGFAEFGSLRFGQRVFSVAAVLEKNSLEKMVDEGIIKWYNQEVIQTNISEQDNFSGSPLFNIKGELVGLNMVGLEGNVSAISIKGIRGFIGF